MKKTSGQNGEPAQQSLGAKFRKAREVAEWGDAGVQLYLGVLYATGHGVAEDQVQAARWYRCGCEADER